MTPEPIEPEIEALARRLADWSWHPDVHRHPSWTNAARKVLQAYVPRDTEKRQACDGSGELAVSNYPGAAAIAKRCCSGCHNCKPTIRTDGGLATASESTTKQLTGAGSPPLVAPIPTLRLPDDQLLALMAASMWSADRRLDDAYQCALQLLAELRKENP